MKNGREKFRTTNLDLACVLVTEGYTCNMKKLGPVNAEFVFDKTSDVERLSESFYKGNVEANITTFMYARFALKRELSRRSIEWERAKTGKLVLNPGQFYYFIADDGKPYKNVYANREPHTTRIVNGNAFLTMNEAQVAATNAKVD